MSAPPVLRVTDLSAGYGTPVLRDLNLEVPAGHLVGLFGANGAGKTTTMMAISGALPSVGSVEFDGREAPPTLHARARAGIAYVTESRGVFMGLTVMENLRLGRGDPQAAFDLFPELVPLRRRKVANLSGGEQQMLALGRALASAPRLLLVDELSLGLAPKVVERLLIAVREQTRRGVAALIVEQHIDKALRFVDYGYVLQRGEILLEGTAAELRAAEHAVAATYLGDGAGRQASAP